MFRYMYFLIVSTTKCTENLTLECCDYVFSAVGTYTYNNITPRTVFFTNSLVAVEIVTFSFNLYDVLQFIFLTENYSVPKVQYLV